MIWYLQVYNDLNYKMIILNNYIKYNQMSDQKLDIKEEPVISCMLGKKTCKELINICKKKGIKGFTKKNKEGLIKLLEDKNTKVLTSQFIPKINITKPILKWVGGKSQIIDKIICDFPLEMNNYHEIFLGGGSVLLALLCYVKSSNIKVYGNIYAYDLNEPLIYMYKNIQKSHIELYDCIQNIIGHFNECKNEKINRIPINITQAKSAKENYYYWIRNQYNNLSLIDKKSILGSSMFIFLNKTCFRGIFRLGPKGFNVPYGHYNNPEIINREHLEEIHNLIQSVIFEHGNFSSSIQNIEQDDFTYFDPPYAPETDKSFVGYTEKGFSIKNNKELFDLIHVLTDTNKKIMLSNSDVSLIRDNFTIEKYNIVSILCKRSINSKNPNSKTKEVIIKNY
jgi:DNA adenine methylase